MAKEIIMIDSLRPMKMILSRFAPIDTTALWVKHSFDEHLWTDVFSWYIYRKGKWYLLFTTTSPSLPTDFDSVEIDVDDGSVTPKPPTPDDPDDPVNPGDDVADNGLEDIDVMWVDAGIQGSWLGTRGEDISDRSVYLYKDPANNDWDNSKTFYKRVQVHLVYTADDNDNSSQGIQSGIIEFVRKNGSVANAQCIDFTTSNYDGALINGEYNIILDQYEDGRMMITTERSDLVAVPSYDAGGRYQGSIDIPYYDKRQFLVAAQGDNYIDHIDFTNFHSTPGMEYQVHVWAYKQDNFVVTAGGGGGCNCAYSKEEIDQAVQNLLDLINSYHSTRKWYLGDLLPGILSND